MKRDVLSGLLVLIAATLATGASTEEAGKVPAVIPPIKDGVVQPQSTAVCRPAQFRAAELATSDGGHLLKVTYVEPDVLSVPILSPLIYVKAPDYWQLNFQYCSTADGVAGILPLAREQHMRSLPGTETIADFPLGGVIGLKGIDLVGSSSLMRKRFDIAQ